MKNAVIQSVIFHGDLVNEFRYLQDQVSRQKTVRTSGRTVVLQTLHKDPGQVSTTDLDSQLSLDPLQPHKAGLHPPQASGSNPATRTQQTLALYQLQTILHLVQRPLCTRTSVTRLRGDEDVVPPEGALRAGSRRGLFRRWRHGALVLLAQRVDGRVKVGRTVLLAAERLHARA